MKQAMPSFHADILLTRAIEWCIVRLPGILLILILAGLAFWIVRFLTNRMGHLVKSGDRSTLTARAQRARTLSRVIRGSAIVLIVMVAGMMILEQVGINIAPVIAGAGIAGLAVGFGAQSLVRDFIGGFFILLENHFSVGDTVKVTGVSGVVESMNLRATTLRDVDGAVHIIPNGEIKVVSNMTRDWSRALLDINVGYGEDIDKAMSMLRDVCNEIKNDPVFGKLILKDPEIPGIENLGESSVTIRIVVDTEPLKQSDVMRELRRRVKRRFDEAGIHSRQ